MQRKLPDCEWPYIIEADSVPAKGRHVKMKATAEQCAALAKRIGVAAVKSAQADLDLSSQNGGHVLHVDGHLQAEVTQNCVMTFQPFDTFVEDNFEAWYADYDKAVPFNRAKVEAKAKMEGDDIQILDEKEDPEPMVEGKVDIGDLVIQYLSLAINPYPRHPSQQREDGESLAGAGESPVAAKNLRPNPFAALKNWRPQD